MSFFLHKVNREFEYLSRGLIAHVEGTSPTPPQATSKYPQQASLQRLVINHLSQSSSASSPVHESVPLEDAPGCVRRRSVGSLYHCGEARIRGGGFGAGVNSDFGEG